MIIEKNIIVNVILKFNINKKITTTINVVSSKKIFIYSLRNVLLRSVLYTSSMLIYFGCLSFLPIAIVGAGMFTSPIFVLLISYFFYNEEIGARRISAVLIGSIGVWVILDLSLIHI